MVLTLLSAALAQSAGPPPVLWEDDRGIQTVPSAFGHPVGGFGVGVFLGLPTGISAAYRPEGRAWFDAGVGWAFDRNTLDLHADVLYTLAEPRTDDIPDVRFPFWIGLGPRARLGDTPETPGSAAFALAARVPLGMSVVHDALPLEAFVELTPGLGLYPTFFAMFDVGVGARYYFGRKAAPVAAERPASSPAPSEPAPVPPPSDPAPAAPSTPADPAAPSAPAP
jgi:hypothetical protein